MKATFLTAVLIIALAIPAQAQVPSFADIPWGASRSQVKAQMMEEGLRFDEQDDDGDLWFRGSLMHENAQVLALFANGKLVKTIVSLLTADQDAIEKYGQMRKLLIGKYGEPAHTFVDFDDPYEYGDGYEEQAIRLGKADITTFWNFGDSDGGVLITISKKLTVNVVYESDDWGKEADRRRSRAGKAF